MTKATEITQAELIAALLAEKAKTAELQKELAHAVAAKPVKKSKPMVIFTGQANADGSAEVAKPTKAQAKALKELENCILGVVHVSVTSNLTNGYFMHTNAHLRQPGVKKGKSAQSSFDSLGSRI